MSCAAPKGAAYQACCLARTAGMCKAGLCRRERFWEFGIAYSPGRRCCQIVWHRGLQQGIVGYMPYDDTAAPRPIQWMEKL
jgi:hypothetical protein